jgi:hypothetical protein
MFCATLVPEQPISGKGKSRAIKAQTPSLAVPLVSLVEWAGSRANRPSRAVARPLASVTTVPLPAVPSVMPCCASTLAMVTTPISTPVADVLGWFQIFEIEFIRKSPRKEKGGLSRLGFS